VTTSGRQRPDRPSPPAGHDRHVAAVDLEGRAAGQAIGGPVPALVIIRHRHPGVRLRRHPERIEAAGGVVPAVRNSSASPPIRIVSIVPSSRPRAGNGRCRPAHAGMSRPHWPGEGRADTVGYGCSNRPSIL